MESFTGSKPNTTFRRLQREMQQFLQEQEKLLEQQRAKREVELYESHIAMLRAIHLDADAPIDWEAVRTNDPPFEPGSVGPRETEAVRTYEAYRPSLWDRMFGRASAKQGALQERVIEAREQDERELEAWRRQVELASRILSGDAEAYAHAIELRQPFADLTELGSHFTFEAADSPQQATVECRIHAAKVVPLEVKSLTKTGRLSVSPMSVTGYHALAQDFVCSMIFRIARDMFALLPLHEVFVHVTDMQLNEAVGRTELVTIVSARINRNFLDALHLPMIDPSEALTNFEHRMDFLKTKGFRPIKRVDA